MNTPRPHVPSPSGGNRLGRSCQLRSCWREARRETDLHVLPPEGVGGGAVRMQVWKESVCCKG